MKLIISLLKKYQKIVLYLIFGFASTIVYFAIYYSFINVFNVNICVALSWIGAVTAAYLTNKKYVFCSKNNTHAESFKELANFFFYRILSLLVDLGLTHVFIFYLHFSHTSLVARAIIQFIVVVLNYFFSKLFIFKNVSHTKIKN